MRLMDTDTQNQVRDLLSAVQSPVTIHLFTQEFECGYCKETRQIAEEVAELSDHVTLQVHDFVKDQALAEAMGIDKIPALAINGENDRDYGIRFYGIPSGYEFTSKLEAILAAAPGARSRRGDEFAYQTASKTLCTPGLRDANLPQLPALVLGHRRRGSDKVRADMDEVTEFLTGSGMRYDVANRHQRRTLL